MAWVRCGGDGDAPAYFPWVQIVQRIAESIGFTSANSTGAGHRSHPWSPRLPQQAAIASPSLRLPSPAALPGLSGRVNREWMGYRPSTPDSVPVIGPSPRCPSIIYAFGHGHLGLTLGPATGKLVASVVAGRSAGIDLAPYRPGRF